MTEAVIVSTARTPIGKAYKGALNHTEGATLLGHAISSALSRAKIEGAEVEDVVMGCAMQQGTTGMNIARKALLRAGLPVSVAGTTIDRQCASGLQAIALAARSVIFEKFGQATKAAGRMQLGLGLYFCRLATEAHGGRIWVEETGALPTVFVMELPT